MTTKEIIIDNKDIWYKEGLKDGGADERKRINYLIDNLVYCFYQWQEEKINDINDFVFELKRKIQKGEK
jgi:hypothetical protein